MVPDQAVVVASLETAPEEGAEETIVEVKTSYDYLLSMPINSLTLEKVRLMYTPNVFLNIKGSQFPSNKAAHVMSKISECPQLPNEQCKGVSVQASMRSLLMCMRMAMHAMLPISSLQITSKSGIGIA